MTHNKANKSKILALILGLTMCIALNERQKRDSVLRQRRKQTLRV